MCIKRCIDAGISILPDAVSGNFPKINRVLAKFGSLPKESLEK
ncbi:hypothetical protein EVA_04339 [gut metagenome]|uniref:Uncharacterized protein n=1 Tax=gut metagenome TaxID=749906 RepID=J9GX06_9ZZZZ